MLIVLGHRAGVDIAASAIHGNAGRQQRQSHVELRNWPTAHVIPRTSPNSAGTNAADIDRLIWSTVGALFPDDYPQTYGIRSFFGL